VRPKNVYGLKIGILMLDTSFPRFPGDAGNATTFDFPVKYRVVKGAPIERAIFKADRTVLKPFVEAGKELEDEGVQAITTSCGFLAMFQREITESLSVPVFTSSLLQVPIIRAMIKRTQKVGIITADKPSLGKKHFHSVGIEDTNGLVIEGMENEPAWRKWSHFKTGDLASLRVEVEKAVVKVSTQMLQKNPEVAAIVFECTNLPPYANAVQQATGRPIFDIVTITKYVYTKQLPGIRVKPPQRKTNGANHAHCRAPDGRRVKRPCSRNRTLKYSAAN
jgi:Asp/Glu/hydantoin racemase